VFCVCAAGSFRSTSPDADKLRSWEPALFIHFIGTVRFCLFALPPARPITNTNILAQGASTTIDLGAGGTYTYLFAKYDGRNDNSQVWDVGDLSGTITIPENGPRGHGLSGWILFGPGTPGVPDGGTAVMLLGAALGALGIARRP
jgi:hypothetical protein